MKPLQQRSEFGCGPACVAMLCDVSLSEAVKACGERDWKNEGIDEPGLRAAFSQFNYELGKAEEIASRRDALLNEADNLLLWGPILNRHNEVIWNEKSRKAQFSFDAPSLRSLVVQAAQSTRIEIDTYDHWAVWDGEARALRDPYGYQSMFVPVYLHRVWKR